MKRGRAQATFRKSLRRLILEQQWKKLQVTANRSFLASRDLTNKLSAAASLANIVQESVHLVRSTEPQKGKALNQSPEWPAVRATMAASFRARHKRLSSAKLSKRLALMGSTNTTELAEDAATSVLASLSSRQEESVNSLVASLIARSVASFNLQYSHDKPQHDGRRWLVEVDRNNADHIAALKAVLSEGKPSKIIKMAGAIERSVESTLLIEANRAGVSEASSLKSQALQSEIAHGIGMRRLLLLYSIAAWIETCVRSGDLKWLALQQKRANSLELGRLDSLIPNLPSRAKKAETFKENQVINLMGRVQSVHIAHRAKKVISSAIVSLSSGREITIAVPYLKLDSGGMVPGSAARIIGTYHTHLEWFPDRPAIVPLRLTSGLNKVTDWATSMENQIRNIYIARPHSLAIDPGWVPGWEGPANVLVYQTYFAGPGKG